MNCVVLRTWVQTLKVNLEDRTWRPNLADQRYNWDWSLGLSQLTIKPKCRLELKLTITGNPRPVSLESVELGQTAVHLDLIDRYPLPWLGSFNWYFSLDEWVFSIKVLVYSLFSFSNWYPSYSSPPLLPSWNACLIMYTHHSKLSFLRFFHVETMLKVRSLNTS